MNIKNRQIGIDLIKMLAAYSVVVIHVNNNWGGYPEMQAGWIIGVALQTLVNPAVNLFALTSGYLMSVKRFKYEHILYVWFMGLFYAILVFMLVNNPAHSKSITDIMFPIFSNNHWYLSQYFFVLVLTPLLNKFIAEMNKIDFLYIFVIILIFCVASNMYFDPYNMNYGYSYTWLICLYFVGAYIRKYQVKIEVKLSVCLWLLSCILMFAAKISIHYLTLKLLGVSKWSGFFFTYNSVLTLVQAVSLFMIFTRVEIRQTKIAKIILFFSTSTLGIYLGQDLFLWSKLNFFDTKYPLILYLPSIFLTSAITMVLAAMIDKIRVRLFKLLAVDRLCLKTVLLVRKRIGSLK